jgi:DNA recombination protein RmuC
MDVVTILGWAVLSVLLLAILVLLLALFLRKPQDASSAQNLIANFSQGLGGMQVDLKGISDRVAIMERNQAAFGQNVSALGVRLAETDTLAKGIHQTAGDIRTGLESAQKALASIQGHAAARVQQEQQTAESVRRLENVIAGTKSKGTAGENIMDLVFSQLPAEWQVRDFPIGNKSVEFGLRLPNNLILPIDSKWAATGLLEEFLAAPDLQEQQRIKAEIERAVLQKAREVRKYIDPSITVGFGIATVPDAVFDLCAKAQVESMRMNVVLLSYSMFVPYLLLTVETVLKAGRDVDLQKLMAYLDAAQQTVGALQAEMEGRLSRAITMLSNSRDEMRAMLARISTGLAALQLGTGGTPEPAPLPAPETEP